MNKLILIVLFLLSLLSNVIVINKQRAIIKNQKKILFKIDSTSAERRRDSLTINCFKCNLERTVYLNK